MHYLIDGHNLIAHLPDIDLADPDDEVKLVLKLRQFAARTKKKITVVFDGGLPGGVSQELSTSLVHVKFASAAGMSADLIMLNAIKKAKHPNLLTVVSSDHQIADQAKSRKIATLSADQFMRQMQPPGNAPAADAKDENPRLSAAEVEEWLRLFSKDKE